jgi:ribosomal protein L32
MTIERVLPWLKGIGACLAAYAAVILLVLALKPWELISDEDRSAVLFFDKVLFMGLAAMMAQARNRSIKSWIAIAFFVDLAFVILLFLPVLSVCTKCGAKNLPHAICHSCGNDGRLAGPRTMVENDFNASPYGPREMTERDL